MASKPSPATFMTRPRRRPLHDISALHRRQNGFSRSRGIPSRVVAAPAARFFKTTVALEAFKGDHVDWRFESSAKDWATAYDFPAVAEKRVIREELKKRGAA